LRVKAVLFDLDETLTDAQAGLKAAHAEVAKELQKYLMSHGVKVSRKKIRKKMDELDDEMNVKRKYDRDEWWPELCRMLDVKFDLAEKIRKKMTKTYWFTFASKNRPYPGAETVLSKLKKNGYKLGLVTDTDGKKGLKRRRLKRISLVRFFDTVAIGGDDTSHAKPSPESFLLAAKKLHVAPGECLMVGDKPFTDIRGAKAAGMKAVLLKKRDWKTKDRPDAVIRALPEVLLLLEKP